MPTPGKPHRFPPIDGLHDRCCNISNERREARVLKVSISSIFPPASAFPFCTYGCCVVTSSLVSRIPSPIFAPHDSQSFTSGSSSRLTSVSWPYADLNSHKFWPGIIS